MPSGPQRTVIQIVGMRSNVCRERVIDAISQVDGVIEADVSLIRGEAVVLHAPRCTRENLSQAIAAAGYLTIY